MSRPGTRIIGLTVLCLLAAAASVRPALGEPLRRYEIAAQLDDRVVVYAGSAQGLTPGDRLQVWRSGRVVGLLQVREAYGATSQCAVIDPAGLQVAPHSDYAAPVTRHQPLVYQPAPEPSRPAPLAGDVLDQILRLDVGQEVLLLGAGAESIILAAKRRQPIEEAPASVWVLTRQDIEALPAATVPELFYYVPGFDVLMLSDGNSEVSVRGFNQGLSNKLLVMLDGRVVYKDYYGAVLWKELPVFIEDIERIEMVRGPGSALYGENAFLGVVNIITRRPGAESGGRVGAAVGPHGTFQTTAVYETGGEALRTKAVVGHSDFRRFDYRGGPANPFDADGASESIAHTRTSKGYATAVARLSRGGELTVDLGGVDSRLKLYPALGGDPYDEEHSQRFASLGYDNMAEAGRLTARVSLNRFDAELPHPADQATLGIAEQRLLTERRIDFNVQYGTELGDRHLVAAGLDLKATRVESPLLAARNRTVRALGGYVQDEWRVADNTVLTLGLRRDRGSLLGSETSPRASVVHRLPGGDVIRGSFSTAFRSPTFYDAYYMQQKTGFIPVENLPDDLAALLPGQQSIEYRFAIYGNPDLASEKIQAYELAWERNRAGARLSLTLFHNEVENLILPLKLSDLTYDPLSGILRGSATFANTAKAVSRGFEAAVRYGFSPNTLGFLTLSHQEVYRKDSKEYLPYSPRFKLSGVLTRRLNPDLTLSLLMRHRGKQYVVRSVNDPGVSVSPVTIFSLKVFLKSASRGLDISFWVDDIFNKQYYDSPWYAPLGRTYWLGAEHGF